MKPDNASELLDQADIDGGLIGGASLKAKSFLELVTIAQSKGGNGHHCCCCCH
jgi:triosephosphate isomerase